jgi:hypothetical protein
MIPALWSMPGPGSIRMQNLRSSGECNSRCRARNAYGERELERAGLARINWISELDVAAATVMSKFQNLTYFFGVKGLQNYGLLNDPNLGPSLTPAPKAAGGVAWIKSGAIVATASEIYADIQALYFQLVVQTAGHTSAITFASGAVAASLSLTQATGAVVSPGADAATPGAFMTGVTLQTQNWATFQTVFDPDNGEGNDQKFAFAIWASDRTTAMASSALIMIRCRRRRIPRRAASASASRPRICRASI